MRKLNYKNIWLMLVLISSVGLIISDLFTVMTMRGRFTIFGLIIHIICWHFTFEIGDYFYEKLQ